MRRLTSQFILSCTLLVRTHVACSRGKSRWARAEDPALSLLSVASTSLAEETESNMSRIAGASAVSVRDQRRTTSSGKQLPSLSLGILSVTVPTQVSSPRSR